MLQQRNCKSTSIIIIKKNVSEYYAKGEYCARKRQPTLMFRQPSLDALSIALGSQRLLLPRPAVRLQMSP